MTDPGEPRPWPITVASLRDALGYSAAQGDLDELTLFAAAACERIDRETGRSNDPTRHMVGGQLPISFTMAARELAKFMWQQSKNGPRNIPQSAADQTTPQGIDLPRKVQGILSNYPPPPGFGQPVKP